MAQVKVESDAAAAIDEVTKVIWSATFQPALSPRTRPIDMMNYTHTGGIQARQRLFAN